VFTWDSRENRGRINGIVRTFMPSLGQTAVGSSSSESESQSYLI
jgi:hypothetical protein